MFNVLITSDIHFHEYPTVPENCKDPHFRLNQFSKLGTLMLDTAKEKDCKELWICGDLLGVANATPRVMNALKTFLTRFTDNNITVRIALGNHDVLVRTNKTDIDEYSNYTLVSLLNDNKNIHVYNSEIVDIDNKKVHFQSWVPDNSFKTYKADYLVAHGDFSTELSPFASSNLICTKDYTRAFIGHIHIPKEIDNAVSPGVPIAHNHGDDPNTSFLVFDLDSNSYERISTKDHFMKFLTVKTKEEALLL